MIALLNEVIQITRNQWKLFAITILIHLIQSFDPGFGEMNFGLVLLLAIPVLLGLIYDYSLTKFIFDKIDKKELSNKDLKEILFDYKNLVPKLFFPLIALIVIILLILGIVSGIVYGLFALLNIQNEKSIFESGVTDLNFILIYSLINIAFAFLIYQAPLFFIKKEPFFRALVSSIKMGIKHWKFTLLIGLTYSLIMFSTSIIGSGTWYQNLFNGLISGIEYYVMAALVLVYYLKHIHNKKVT